MSMQAASLEILEQVDIPSPVARAIVRVFDVEFTEARKTLATKQDLSELRHVLERQIAGSHDALATAVHGGRGDLEVRIGNLRSDLEVKIDKFRSDLEVKIDKFRGDLEVKIEKLHGDLRVDMANLKSELIEKMHALKSDGNRQLYVALAAQTGFIFGAFYFFITYVMK